MRDRSQFSQAPAEAYATAPITKTHTNPPNKIIIVNDNQEEIQSPVPGLEKFQRKDEDVDAPPLDSVPVQDIVARIRVTQSISTKHME